MEMVKEILSFYTPYASIEKMSLALRNVLQERIMTFQNENACFMIRLRDGSCIRIPYISAQTDEKTLQMQIQKLYQSIMNKNCEKTHIKQNLLYQIALFRGAYVFEFDYQKGERDQKILPLMEIADQMDALIFWESGDVSDSYGDVILAHNGKSEVSIFNPVHDFDISNPAVGLSEAQIKRIQRSMSILHYKGIYAPNTIAPPYEDKMYIYQEEEDILKRSIACMILAIYADFFTSHGHNAMLAYEYVEKMIRLYRASPFFTIKEIEFLNDPRPSDLDIHTYQGYYECCYTMLWVLGFMENLYFPSSLCCDSLVVRTIFSYDSLTKLLEQAKLREKAELLDAIDLVQRYEWGCLDARKLNFELPAGLLYDIVSLRHKTLAWIINENDASWDNVQTKIKSLSIGARVEL